MVFDRLTKVKTTARPPNVYPETWDRFSDKQKELAKADWLIEKENRDRARTIRGIGEHVDPVDLEAYDTCCLLYTSDAADE